MLGKLLIRMKLTPILLALALSTLSLNISHAFSLGDVAKGADALTNGGGSTNLLSMGSQLLGSFQGNEQAMSAAKGLMGSFKAKTI